MMARRLACAQPVPVPGDVEENVRRHVALARLAAAERPEVVVFPELSLTGYELERADELAFERRDARLAALGQLATELEAALIVGAPLRDDGKLYLGAFVLLPSGEELVHTKRFLGAFD